MGFVKHQIFACVMKDGVEIPVMFLAQMENGVNSVNVIAFVKTVLFVILLLALVHVNLVGWANIVIIHAPLGFLVWVVNRNVSVRTMLHVITYLEVASAHQVIKEHYVLRNVLVVLMVKDVQISVHVKTMEHVITSVELATVLLAG